jgi:hypothetical protein
MILRVVALYNRSKKIFAFLLFIWTGQIIISAIGLRGSFGKCSTNIKLLRALKMNQFYPSTPGLWVRIVPCKIQVFIYHLDLGCILTSRRSTFRKLRNATPIASVVSG